MNTRIPPSKIRSARWGWLGLLLAAHVGVAAMPAANWDRQLAAELGATPAADELYLSLQRAFLDTDTEALALALRQVETGPGPAWPVREAALLRFTQSLHRYPRSDVPAAAVETLKAWRPRTLVPNDDHPSASDALFPVSTAAWGLDNRWRRAEAMAVGRELLSATPEQFIDRWQSLTDPAERAGMLDALAVGSPGALGVVHDQALLRLPVDGALSPLASRAALATGDIDAMEQVIRFGTGAGLRPALERAGRMLFPTEAATLLGNLVDRAPPENVALAIAAWSDLLAGDARAEGLLLGLLDHDQLGAAAALALGENPSPGTLDLLAEVADGEASIAATRARWALEVHANRLDEVLP